MADANARRTTLLLVEDDDGDADRFRRALDDAARGAFEVTRATSLAEGVSYLETTRTDCAVVELGLADAEGVGIIETLSGRAPAVALIALIDGEDDELGVATIEAGASDYVAKRTLGGELLVRTLRHAILRKRFDTSLAEAQRIARLGSWEVDLVTNTVSWSRELYRLFAVPLEEQPSYGALLARTHPDDREATAEAVRVTLEEHEPFVIEHRIVLPDGTERWIRSRGRVELDATGRPERLLGTAQDIMEQKTAEEALVYQAFHDPRSGLPNRLLLLDRLGQALLRLGRQPSTVGLVHIDIDRFKVINESLGHPVGDQLLAALAVRLTYLLRPGDTLARVDGDEFVVLCEGLTGESEAVGIADRICEAVAEPLPWQGGELVISASAGVAVASDPSVSAESLLRNADAAMYRAKSEGRARSAVFAQTMRAKAIGRLDTEISLRRSILDGDLRVHYQPIVTLADGQVLGHEALVRWEHPARGMLGPDHFITIAEETGLIVPLGGWVLREACLQAKRFQSLDPRWSRLTMSVNLSGGQLREVDLVELVASALHDADLKPEHLQLEMTESVLMDDAAATVTILQRLKGLGVKLVVDDFGTGYSSLAYLRRFPVDVLKIDRSFVDGLGKDLEDSAVAAAIVSLADTLGLAVVAEGVETTLQRDCLVALGCSRAQGYLFARPAPAADAEALLGRAAARPRTLQEALATGPADGTAPVASLVLRAGRPRSEGSARPD